MSMQRSRGAGPVRSWRRLAGTPLSTITGVEGLPAAEAGLRAGNAIMRRTSTRTATDGLESTPPEARRDPRRYQRASAATWQAFRKPFARGSWACGAFSPPPRSDGRSSAAVAPCGGRGGGCDWLRVMFERISERAGAPASGGHGRGRRIGGCDASGAARREFRSQPRPTASLSGRRLARLGLDPALRWLALSLLTRRPARTRGCLDGKAGTGIAGSRDRGAVVGGGVGRVLRARPTGERPI